MIFVCMKNSIHNLPITFDDIDELVFITLYLKNFDIRTKSWVIGNDDFFLLDLDIEFSQREVSNFSDRLCSNYILSLEL